MTRRGVPFAWRPLRSWGEVERRGGRGGVIVIFDDPTAGQRSPRYHHVTCPHVDETHFETKRANAWSTGEYYWAPDASSARLLSVPCGDCHGEPVAPA